METEIRNWGHWQTAAGKGLTREGVSYRVRIISGATECGN
jgi:hypothetical protein